MHYQIAIYSSDVVFARMLELEFLMFGKRVLCREQPAAGDYADTVLLDLDNVAPPEAQGYRKMIGFTKNSSLLSDDVRRQCSMILHRPFEMRLLRRELLQEDFNSEAEPDFSQKDALQALQLDNEHAVLYASAQPILLTHKELLVMQLLLNHRGKVVSRAQISHVIGESSANKADVYICYLRRKLESALACKVIYTARQKGYYIK